MENMHNLNMERAILSTVLFEPWSEDAEYILHNVDAHDFHMPFHQYFFASCLELKKSEKPIEDEFIRGALTKIGKYDEVGMLDIIASTPITNIKAYVNELREMSQKRSLSMVASGIKKHISEEGASPLEIIQETIKRVESIAEKGTVVIQRKSMAYAKESEPEFMLKNWLPIPKGTTSMIVAPGGTGKALCNGEKVLTSSGWVAMGDITLEHDVIGSDGLSKKIEGIYPQGKRDIYRVTFIDGTSVMCDLDHLWTVSDRKNDNVWKVLTTREIIENGVVSREKYDKRYGTFQKEWRYGIPFGSENHFGSNEEIKIHPYLMGVILGDGCITKSNVTISNKSKALLEGLADLLPDGDIIKILKYEKGAWYASITTAIASRDKSSVALYLEAKGLLGMKSECKFIPKEYFTADLPYRKLLIQGLIDTDGYMKDGQLDEYSTSSKELADGFLEIGRSIGMQLSIKDRKSRYKKNDEYTECKENYRIRERFRNANSKSIVSIEYSHNNDATCIKIDAEDSLFVTSGYNLTHNTWLILQLAIRAAREDAGRKIFLWLSEDPEGIVKSRYKAIIDKVLIGRRETEDSQIDISTEDPLLLLESNGRSMSLSSRFYAMKRELRDYDVIVIDPLLAFYGGDENDNSQARVFMQPFLNWARSENKSIIFLHHSRKGDGNGGSKARGAGAIVDAVRCVYDMDKVYVKKSDGKALDPMNLHMRTLSLSKDNYGASQHLEGFEVMREITPKHSARALEVEYEESGYYHKHEMPEI